MFLKIFRRYFRKVTNTNFKILLVKIYFQSSQKTFENVDKMKKTCYCISQTSFSASRLLLKYT